MIVSNHFETPDKQLLMMITGLAGSGKSYVINSIRSLLREVCLITAYFGIAAFNVKGKTLHSILQLPIRGKNSHELKGDALLKLHKRLSGIQYIIIDEYSVVGQKLLGWIDRRCRQATTKNHEPFGGISIILVGDIAQLPPVGDKVLYYKRHDGETDTLAFMMYRKFETVKKLTKNERSTGDGDSQEQFRNLLYNLRNGDSSVDDWHRLLTRTPDKIRKDVDVKQYVKLYFSNEKIANNNYIALKSLSVPIAKINAHHNNKAAAKLPPGDMRGLVPALFLSIGAGVMLTRNLWTEKGLCNGSMGVVKDIIYQEENSPPLLPIAVVVKFDHTYTGPSICLNDACCVPIVASTNVSDLHGSSHERGLTLDKAWIDLGLTEKFIGLAYVAISRVRKLNDLIIEPMTLERLRDIKTKKNYRFRVAEELRINDLALTTIQSNCF